MDILEYADGIDIHFKIGQRQHLLLKPDQSIRMKMQAIDHADRIAHNAKTGHRMAVRWPKEVKTP